MKLDSLYIHVPFCAAKCDYCAFYSRPNLPEEPRAAYLQRLGEEMAAKRALAGPLRSVFIGGGTPTFLPAGELAELLELLHRNFALAADCEFSIESNPETITAGKLEALLAGGVNRVSLGVQSFSARTRRTIGRTGALESVYRAVELLQARGFANYNCDMIYGVPGQSLVEWEADLRALLELQPAHVSTYALSIEPGTPLAARALEEVGADSVADMWGLAGAILGEAGLDRYEISNFARPGRECRHNLEVWYGRPFLAVGPAAHSFDGHSRWANPADLEAWLRGDPPVEDALEPEARAVEILITGLRTVNGWTRNQFRDATTFDFLEFRGPRI